MSGRLVLVRHGQSHGNVDRRLDTRPPGSGAHRPRAASRRARSRRTGRTTSGWSRIRSRCVPSQTAAEIGAELNLDPHELDGIHEVQVGELEDRNDDAAVERVQRHLRALASRASSTCAMPGGEPATQVLDRYVPVITAAADALSRRRRVARRHRRRQPRRGDPAGRPRRWRVWTEASPWTITCANAESVVLTPITDGRWSCVQWGAAQPAVLSRARAFTRSSRRPARRPTRWADAQAQPTASQSMRRTACTTSGRDAAVLGALRPLQRVMDDGAVAVFEPASALAAVAAHEPFIAPEADNPRMPRPSRPCCRAELLRPSRVRAAGRRRCRSGGRSRG